MALTVSLSMLTLNLSFYDIYVYLYAQQGKPINFYTRTIE